MSVIFKNITVFQFVIYKLGAKFTDMRKILFFFLLIFCPFIYGQSLKTEPLSDDIQTIRIDANGEWGTIPVINRNSNDFVRISFDRIGEESYNYLRYRIVHCNADWTKSSLADVEFLNGFNNNEIEDYANSTTTNVLYTNYQLQIPNNNVKLKLAGNYAVEVFEEDNPSNVLLRACFSVLDKSVQVGGTVSSLTDIDANKEHQQVSFSVSYNNLQVRDVFSDLKVYVRQNNRLDNQKSLVKPTSVQGNKLVYEHNRNLIFEAGNEYRRFESVSHRYKGMNVQNIEYRRPNYYISVYPDKIRANRAYSFDEDQNGRFLIRNAERNDSDTEADYFYTKFTLKSPDPFIEPIYINGDFTYDTFDERYLMQYDAMNEEYSLTLLLKQGAYNYQYLAGSGNIYTPALTEGNYYQTENEYSIYVYYRPLGTRYDLLVGFLKIGGR